MFYELFNGLPRGGPGGNEYTRKAYKQLEDIPSQPRILDVGCGPGMQTLELARLSSGHVTGLDTHQPHLDVLEKAAKAGILDDKLEVINGSMFKLENHFELESVDIIWSEGAIYIMGFEAGLKAWRKFLKTNGYIAVTELAWLKSEPPGELIEFWKKEYPGMKSLEENREIITASGYSEISYFVLPDSAWWEQFYVPLEGRVQELKEQYKNDPKAREVLDTTEQEIALFRKYSEWYGYVFYIMQKE